MKFEEIPIGTFFMSSPLDLVVGRAVLVGQHRLYHRKISNETFETYVAEYSKIKLIHTMLLPLDMFNNPQLIICHNYPMDQKGDLLAVGDEVVVAIKGKLVRGKIQEIIIPNETKMLKMSHNIIHPHGLRIIQHGTGNKFNLTRGTYRYYDSPILKISSLAP